MSQIHTARVDFINKCKGIGTPYTIVTSIEILTKFVHGKELEEIFAEAAA